MNEYSVRHAASGRLADFETPKLVIDRPRLERNIAVMAARARDLGVALRPHMKTTKSADVARLCVNPASPRITVSTLKEAEYFAAAGYRDILYGVGIAAHKAGHAAGLVRRGVDLCVTLDSIETARGLAERASAEGVTFPVMLELDTDDRRAGVKPSDPRLLEIARTVAASPSLRLRGVMAHAGASYDCPNLEAVADMAEAERAGAVHAATRIRQAGIEVAEVSVGSTPTALHARSLDGCTELRAGVYMVFDLVMAGVGVCALEDIALSVLATVIGHRADKGWAIVDAGWSALSRDRGTAEQAVDQHYGVVCLEDGRVQEDVVVASVNQEHGLLAARDGRLDLRRFPIGARVRILPNHACATGTQHDSYLVVGSDGLTVEAEWPRINGW